MHNSNQTRTKARQYAALPFRLNGGNAIEVMLITSRETRRWVIPKGWPIKGLKPHETAACEAYEEAGLTGRITKEAIGSFHYEKRLKAGDSITCEVEVYPLEVRRQYETWPEKHERDKRWFKLSDAAALVAEVDLSETLLKLKAETLLRLNTKGTNKLIQRLHLKEPAIQE
ncbi:NUDIX hydrolase [Microvirga sp. W0021]|uniref:NUDIX hydrolase n=1 Tax=Hohaiivirga grylli TaxID=3133970 RepID=A0ABV0BIL0_9HYPH